MEAPMTRLQLVLSLIAAVAIAGLLMWRAEATPLTGALGTHPVTAAILRFKRPDACSERTADPLAPNGLAPNIPVLWVPPRNAFAGLAKIALAFGKACGVVRRIRN
jgi:hypothetical protein